MKNMKKALSLFVVICMVVALIPASLVSADSTDAKNAILQMHALLNDSTKQDTIKVVVDEAWTYALESVNDGNTESVDEVMTRITDRLTQLGKGGLITTDGSNGTIAESSVRLLVSKVLANKAIFKGLYEALAGNGYLTKAKAMFGNAQTTGELFVNFVAAVKTKQLKVVTLKDGKFVLYDPQNKGLANILSTAFAAELNGDTSFNTVFQLVAGTYALYIDKLNQQLDKYNVAAGDVIELLDLYGLYIDTESTPTPTPTPTPYSGGGGVVSTSTPAPSSTPNLVIPGGVDEVAKIQDPVKAKEKAVEIITKAADLIKKAEAEGKSTAEIAKAMKEIALVALEKVSVQTVKATTDTNGQKAVVSEADATQMAAKLDQILATAKELTETLKKAGADTKVEAVLTIKVEAAKDAKAAQVEFPASLLKAAADKRLDKVAIDAGVSKLVLAPDAIALDNAKTVAFAAKKLDDTALTADAKKFIGNDQVFNFTLTADGKNVDKFKKPVEVAVPFSLKAGDNAKKVTVYYVDDKGNTENVAGTVNTDKGEVKFTTTHFSGYVAKVNNVTFSDLKNVIWAVENIETMAAKGIISGVGGSQFDPESNITRAEFAALMVRAFKLQDASAKNTFTDVQDLDWYSDEVASAVKAGLIQGLGDGTFAPNENITRQDMAAIISRALVAVKSKEKLADASQYIKKFTDSSEIAAYAKDAVAQAVKYEIVKGTPANTFVPADPATRAEAAAMVYRLFFLE